MSAAEERRSFLLSMTLTELALILFFLLLLLSSIRVKLKDEKIQALSNNNPRLAQALPRITSWLEAYSDDDFTRLEQRLQEDPGREKELEAQVSQLTAEKQQLEGRNQDLLGQYKNAERRARGGQDHPPCWANPTTGKTEYIYRVVVREEDLGVAPRWPPHREDDVDRIPGARAFIASHLTIADFERLAAPLLSWSQKQSPECRLFVVIADQATTKHGYKDRRQMIEAFFYKYEERTRAQASEHD